MAIATTDSVTGEVLKEFDELRPEELEDKLSGGSRGSVPVCASTCTKSQRSRRRLRR
ncbi:MAG: hypothetical protein QOJ95_1465 [Mycobacterium sp.]|jgi:hypothetical protein|nr:hypothetical protein [Mycobacterium sp.]